MAEKKRKSFALGYSFVLHSLLMYWVQAILTTSGNNVFIPVFMEKFGWARTTILNFVAIAGVLSVIGALGFAQLVKAFGPRKVTVVALVLGGAAVILFGRVSSLVMFVGITICIHLLAQGWAGVTTNTLIANWYPKKKAVILGITTIGLPLGTVAFVPLLNWIMKVSSFEVAYMSVGIGMIVMGLLSIIWVKDNPEDVGLTPDNEKLTDEQRALLTTKLRNFKSQWTFKKLLRDRNAWLIAIAYGAMFMCNKGVISQISFYLTSKGYTQQEALRLISLFALLAIPGSYIWGLIDNKMGTKRATIVYGIVYGIAFILMFPAGVSAVMWIGIIIFEFQQGGIGNLIPSMMISCYGRYEFPSVNRLLNPVVAAISGLATWWVGFTAGIMGSAARMTIIFAGVMFICVVMVAFVKPNPRDDIDYGIPAGGGTAK